MRPRKLIGYVSARSDPCTLCVDACDTPAPKRAQKNRKMLVARPERKTMMPKKNVAQRDDRGAAVAVGQPAHGQDAEHQEGAGDPGHEDDDARAHSERRLDVGREDAQAGALEVVQGHDDRQDHERRGAAPSQALPQRRPLLARPRQEILGKEHLLFVLGRAEAVLRSVGEEAGQIGGAPARRLLRDCRRGTGRIAHVAPDPNVPGRPPRPPDGFIVWMLRLNARPASEFSTGSESGPGTDDVADLEENTER